MLVSLENVTKLFADRIIFTGVNAAVEEGDRIGLVGANGAGKTTLLNVLNGDYPPDEGNRAVLSGLSIGFLRQTSGLDSENTIYGEMRSVFGELLDAQAKLRRLAARMAQYADHADAEYIALAEEYNRLQAWFETNEGYQIDVKIRTVLNGMGFRAAKKPGLRWPSSCSQTQACSCSTSRPTISISQPCSGSKAIYRNIRAPLLWFRTTGISSIKSVTKSGILWGFGSMPTKGIIQNLPRRGR